MFTIFKNRCYNGGNQHKFEARYDEDRSFPENITSARGMGDIEKLKNYSKTYVKDVCVWCGKEIVR